MVSYMKKSLGTLAGFGSSNLLPPADHLSLLNEDDCTGCANPCAEHKEFPSYLHIEQDFPILGSVKPYGRHILISTGMTDWPKHIDDEKDSFAQALFAAIHQKKPTAWKNLITNASITSSHSNVPGGCDILIFPDNILVSNVTNDKADDFYQLFMAAPLPREPMDIEFMMRDDRIGEMKIQKCPYKNLMLLCSHKKRDKRCGVTAPILAQEIDRVLREKDLGEEDVAIIMVSHIGGHKIAGNVICYINEGTRGVWYGRVKTCHCRTIIEETIVNGKVIKEIYRGAMDNSFENQQTRSLLKW
ncbi:Sucrase/ferredoxin-like-domain-containing protein [Gilbertella persicaria]|uniref:Sucrase/ferredoxin-like-domain-containing protein n=1 Tax=Gilbertella persicaria TaxID=101096 RepID=UPI002220F7F4|nr:Sucrase/ferredoxin-like-domain-containing protein [Gilbertella persicaria]KAI8084300.1 Sucrase/ferredoxin-like-domain-containing protein [Gilbertella persicaria]